MTDLHPVLTCLWFAEGGEEAARSYTRLLPNSAVDDVFRPEPDGPALVVTFHLQGVPYQILNGGPHFRLSPAASIVVHTADQAETDRLWDALTADGGAGGRCGWLVDRWGVSWQIVPAPFVRMLGGPDRAAAGRAREAMMQMSRLDLARLQAAFDGP